MSITKRELASLIFENKKISKMSLIKLNNKNINQQINKIKIPKINISQNELFIKEKNTINNIYNEKLKINTIIKNNIGDKIKEDKMSDKISDNNNSNIKSNISLNDENVIKKINKIESPLINEQRKYLILNDKLKIKEFSKNNNINNISKIRNNNNSLFSYYYFFLDIIFDKLINP